MHGTVSRRRLTAFLPGHLSPGRRQRMYCSSPPPTLPTNQAILTPNPHPLPSNPHRYRDRRQGNLIGLSWFGASPARMKGCWRQRRASSPRAGARPFGQRGLTPVSASNQGSPCDRRLDVAQQPIAIAGSNGLPVFRTPKHSTNSLRIAATTICLGLRRPWDFNRATSATIAGLYRIADIAGM